MKPRKIPGPAIMRLSLYYRGLAESRLDGYISSRELSSITGCTPEQIRQDLSCFGQFGRRGRGYEIANLKDRIRRILGVDRRLKVVVVGAGNLGSALVRYRGFSEQGFDILCAFDADAKKIGRTISGTEVRDISELSRRIRDQKVKIAVMTVPGESAQQLAARLASCGIKAILNFTPVRLKVPPGVSVLNVDLGVELERLSCLINTQEE